jgi:hypothetical protein
MQNGMSRGWMLVIRRKKAHIHRVMRPNEVIKFNVSISRGRRGDWLRGRPRLAAKPSVQIKRTETFIALGPKSGIRAARSVLENRISCRLPRLAKAGELMDVQWRSRRLRLQRQPDRHRLSTPTLDRGSWR